MSQTKPKPRPCPICGANLTGVEAISHMLVAHGPLASPTRKKRRAKVIAMLPKFHDNIQRRAGLSEVQAHHVLDLLTEELRKLGLV